MALEIRVMGIDIEICDGTDWKCGMLCAEGI